MMGSVALVLLVTGISICSGTAIRGDQELDPISVLEGMLQKVEHVSAQLREHDGKIRDLIKGMDDKLTQLELSLTSARKMLPSEPLLDVINSTVMSVLSEISTEEIFRFFAAPTIPMSSHRESEVEVPSEGGKFYCSLDTDRSSARGSCYFLSSNIKKWSDARENCIQMGADLVKLDTDEEFTFLEEQTVGDTWIGLTDKEVDEVYRWTVDWSRHHPMHKQNWWAEGEPSNHNGQEHCIHYKHIYHSLNDDYCYIKKRFLCEMPYKNILL